MTQNERKHLPSEPVKLDANEQKIRHCNKAVRMSFLICCLLAIETCVGNYIMILMIFGYVSICEQKETGKKFNLI